MRIMRAACFHEEQSLPASAKSLRYWTVAETRWREERRAAHHVERLGLKFLLPEIYEPTSGGDDEKRTLLFPGFILFKLRSGWEALSSARGISRILMMPLDDETMVPARVRSEEIARIRSLEDECGVVRLSPRLCDGARVIVDESVGGAYDGVEGIVAGTSARGRVRVLLAMLGRQFSREFSESALRLAS